MPETRQRFGRNAERYAREMLRRRGMSSVKMPCQCPYDLRLANGKRIEIKAAHMNPKTFEWKVNIHRHGQRCEDEVDAYLILLDLSPVGKKKLLPLIIPAPVHASVLSYSVESLLTNHHWQIDNWSAIGVGDWRKLRKKPPTTENAVFLVKRNLSR